jgi:hypothetical protein
MDVPDMDQIREASMEYGCDIFEHISKKQKIDHDNKIRRNVAMIINIYEYQKELIRIGDTNEQIKKIIAKFTQRKEQQIQSHIHSQDYLYSSDRSKEDQTLIKLSRYIEWFDLATQKRTDNINNQWTKMLTDWSLNKHVNLYECRQYLRKIYNQYNSIFERCIYLLKWCKYHEIATSCFLEICKVLKKTPCDTGVCEVLTKTDQLSKAQIHKFKTQLVTINKDNNAFTWCLDSIWREVYNCYCYPRRKQEQQWIEQFHPYEKITQGIQSIREATYKIFTQMTSNDVEIKIEQSDIDTYLTQTESTCEWMEQCQFVQRSPNDVNVNIEQSDIDTYLTQTASTYQWMYQLCVQILDSKEKCERGNIYITLIFKILEDIKSKGM